MRVFIALPVSGEVKRCLAKLASDLRPFSPEPSIRWSDPAQAHLTLRFVGEVPADAAETLAARLREATAGIAKLALHTAAMGCFGPPERPRVLWLGVGGDLAALGELQARVVAATAAFGQIEERPFHPHLTLGRVHGQLGDQREKFLQLIRATCVQPPVAWTADRLQLMRSKPAPGGPRYTELASIPLVNT